MAQVFIPPDDIIADQFILRGPEAHHLARVLRKTKGDLLIGFNGRGRRFEGRLTEIDLNQLIVRGTIVKDLSRPSKWPARHLLQGLPRGSKFDFVLEKAVELGVDVIAPFLSEKNPVRLSDNQCVDRVKRWERVAHAAAKQCDRSDLPLIEVVRALDGYEAWVKDGPTIVLDPSAAPGSLARAITDIPRDATFVNIVVGPEAGFSLQEKEWLQSRGAVSASLGRRTLRSETAGLAVLSILEYVWEH